MRTRESVIEKEFVHQASRLGIEVLGTQVELPIGRLDVLGRWRGLLAVFELKSAAAAGDAISQVISYAEQVSHIIGLEDSGGVLATIVAPLLTGEAVRAWRVGVCEFIRVADFPAGLRFVKAKRDPMDASACFDEDNWCPSKILGDLIEQHYQNQAREIALMLNIHAQTPRAEDGGARVPSDCPEDMESRGSVTAWARLP